MFAGFLYNAIMPELPEVETIKNDLKKVILDKKIIGVKVGKKKIIKSDYGDFLKILKGGVFQDIGQGLGNLPTVAMDHDLALGHVQVIFDGGVAVSFQEHRLAAKFGNVFKGKVRLGHPGEG